MLAFILDHFSALIIILIIVYVCFLFFPIIFFFIVALPFLIVREGYRLLVKALKDRNMAHRIPQISVLLLLLFLLILLLSWQH